MWRIYEDLNPKELIYYRTVRILISMHKDTNKPLSAGQRTNKRRRTVIKFRGISVPQYIGTSMCYIYYIFI